MIIIWAALLALIIKGISNLFFLVRGVSTNPGVITFTSKYLWFSAKNEDDKLYKAALVSEYGWLKGKPLKATKLEQMINFDLFWTPGAL